LRRPTCYRPSSGHERLSAVRDSGIHVLAIITASAQSSMPDLSHRLLRGRPVPLVPGAASSGPFYTRLPCQPRQPCTALIPDLAHDSGPGQLPARGCLLKEFLPASDPVFNLPTHLRVGTSNSGSPSDSGRPSPRFFVARPAAFPLDPRGAPLKRTYCCTWLLYS